MLKMGRSRLPGSGHSLHPVGIHFSSASSKVRIMAAALSYTFIYDNEDAGRENNGVGLHLSLAPAGS